MKQKFMMMSTALAAVALLPLSASASSHQDAPLITLDPSANTTDVYAFVAGGENGDSNKYLVVGLGVYPFEEPGVGPNIWGFDDNVLYDINVATTNLSRGLPRGSSNDVDSGRATLTYEFQFNTTYRDPNTILIAFTGVVTNDGDASQNKFQTYSVRKLDHRDNKTTVIVTNAIVPPNNEGDATPFYNIGNVGTNLAKPGVTNSALLDQYTAEAIYTNDDGYLSFAGQRDDGFYADVLSIFDLLQLRNPGKDSQKGFNIHEMVLRIPISELGSDLQTVGVYATTSRKTLTVLRSATTLTGPQIIRVNNLGRNPFEIGTSTTQTATTTSGAYVQVAREANPLFNEVLVAVVDKDLYSRTSPTVDSMVFAKYALDPEPSALFNDLYNGGINVPNIASNRTDIAYIFIPDLIKVDLSTPPTRLADSGDTNYNSLGIFGGDSLVSQLTTNPVSSGWPNGRRYGDNVADIALAALLDSTNILAPGFGLVRPLTSQGVLTNDEIYNAVFPYESTPQNGRNHLHDSP